ncbi:putative e set [Golovinomyces cichoracearum]|uniref:Putative e set n=1 Tax=Golovinomyces cichoracearum TaxID=62708 RepID=A0A420HLK4_9PEZI|nr:putative e set [Golovinomyces cichoracearum]
MSVRIDIDNPRAVRTNYDNISGRILIFVKTDVKISTILVKLEGESRTQLARSSNGHVSRGGLVIETHKILYQVQQVFPDRSPSSCSTSNILQAGKHEFIFSFKIPLQNECVDYQLTSSEINVVESRMADAQQEIENMQVKRLLPPSLMGHPGFAEIRYFIKVTVRHPQIFKESWRSIAEFKFSPLELARPSWTGEELKTSIPFTFKTKIDSTTASQMGASLKLANSLHIAPKGELHARLPWPAMIM